MAVELLKHAINMILNNIGEALKASAVPLILLFVLGMFVGGPLAELQSVTDITQLEQVDLMAVAGSVLILLIGYLVIFGWLAVAWHRFILLGEYPGPVPAFAGSNVVSYIVQLVILIVILVAIGIVIGLIGGLIGSIIPIFGALISIAMLFVLGYIYLRLALTLPAVAVGARLGIREAWESTGPHSGTFLGIFFLLALLRIVAALPGVLLNSLGLDIVAVAVDLMATWFTLMVGVGILTTLYGHIIEGRPLS